MAKVLIIYRFLPHYRAEFYCRLRELLASRNVQLDLVYGKTDGSKGDEMELPWASFRPNRSLRLGGYELLWQPCLDIVSKYDLVIVEQANRLILNYLLIALRPLLGYKLAFWGHGLNLQSPPGSWVNRFKSLYLGACQWWFAYTEGVKKLLVQRGYPAEQITVVQNSINMQIVEDQLADPAILVPPELAGKPVGLFCGAMYAEKRLDFLLEACQRIKLMVPDFQMVFIGSGNQREIVRKAAAQHSWIHDKGPLFGAEKMAYFKASRAILMPGLVGLVVLDSLAGQVPLVTTHYPYHSPEIEYLDSGRNGLMVDDSAFVSEVVRLMTDSQYVESLRAGCAVSAKRYSLDAMVMNFGGGILNCLGMYL